MGKQIGFGGLYGVSLFHWVSVLAILQLAPSLFSGEQALNAPGIQPSVKQAEGAVKDLGSDDYATRRAAYTSLLQMGRPAIEPLERALQAEDPEVRSSAMRLLIFLRGCGSLGVVLDEESKGVTVKRINSYRDPLFVRMNVEKPMPAETAGFQANDKMLAINDRPLRGNGDFRREIKSIGPARTVIITVEREGKLLRLPATLMRNPIKHEDAPHIPPVDLEKER